MSGSSELTLELTDIMINGTAYPLLTSTYEVKGQGEGKKTAKKVVGRRGSGCADRRNRRRWKGSRNRCARWRWRWNSCRRFQEGPAANDTERNSPRISLAAACITASRVLIYVVARMDFRTRLRFRMPRGGHEDH